MSRSQTTQSASSSCSSKENKPLAKKQLRPCHFKELLIAQAKTIDFKECTFHPKILKTKAAKEFAEQLEPSRAARLIEHLERKEINLQIQIQEKAERDNKELVFKPKISHYQSKHIGE